MAEFRPHPAVTITINDGGALEEPLPWSDADSGLLGRRLDELGERLAWLEAYCRHLRCVDGLGAGFAPPSAPRPRRRPSGVRGRSW